MVKRFVDRRRRSDAPNKRSDEVVALGDSDGQGFPADRDTLPRRVDWFIEEERER